MDFGETCIIRKGIHFIRFCDLDLQATERLSKDKEKACLNHYIEWSTEF